MSNLQIKTGVNSLSWMNENSAQYKDKDIEYYVECIGDFGKGASDNEGKTQGREYIWCRGNYQGEKSSDWKYNGTEQLT